jgi:hypothetical protein
LLVELIDIQETIEQEALELHEDAVRLFHAWWRPSGKERPPLGPTRKARLRMMRASRTETMPSCCRLAAVLLPSSGTCRLDSWTNDQ